MVRLTLALVVGALVGCGGEDGDPYRDPESFADPDVLEQAEHPIARQCLVHQFVLDARIAECAVQEFGRGSPESWLVSCNGTAEEDYPSDYVAKLEGCLDVWANGACDELTGSPEEQANGCAITEAW